MTKKNLNQNAKLVQKFINLVEPDFNFNDKPLNRYKIFNNNDFKANKIEKLEKLKEEINSIQNCNLKKHSKNLVFGDGDVHSPLMIIGEAPGEEEDNLGLTFQGQTGNLLKKMLAAINIKKEDVYITYTVNFRPPEDRKPNSSEIKRYSIFLKEHINIINPKIIIILGGSAMESVLGSKKKVSSERGKWKEIILKDKVIPLIITFNPSYLIRFPENKKYSWEDLKIIKKKIQDLDIKI